MQSSPRDHLLPSPNFLIESGRLPPIKTHEQNLFFSLANPKVRYARMGCGDGDSLLEPILVELLPQCNFYTACQAVEGGDT